MTFGGIVSTVVLCTSVGVTWTLDYLLGVVVGVGLIWINCAVTLPS